MTWRTRALAFAAFVFAGPLGEPPAAAKEATADVRNAVVRVEVSRAGRDWTAPWKLLPVESVSGTAFLIAGDRFLTNAHVVRDAQQVTVKRNDGSAPTLATVEALDDACDLAVLRVSSKSFVQGMHGLKLGDLPRVGSAVVTYGYPVGGQELSTTAGVVSRIEDHTYMEGLAEHLVVQTDAAINPGNSDRRFVIWNWMSASELRQEHRPSQRRRPSAVRVAIRLSRPAR
jgi:S1-C subfamily serine protease